MRGVHSAVDDIRRNVFTEVARLAYESDDYKQVDMIPYKIVPGEVAHHRHDVFLERAIVSARLKLALGMDLDPNGPSAPISANIQDAATDQKYFNEPLVNIIPYACNACPPKQVRITDSCQGCISHPCMNVCPKDAIYLDKTSAATLIRASVSSAASALTSAPTGRSPRWSAPVLPPAAWTPSSPMSWAGLRSIMISASPAVCAW